MPPKPRGRGGRGRGGAGRGALSGAPIPDTVVPKQEDDGDAAPPAAAPPQTDTTDSPAAHASRQRLDSLAEPSSRSASPSVRRGRGKKPAPALPSFTGRRSKAERDARIEEALERERERNKDREKQAKHQARLRAAAEKRLNQTSTRGRGGYSGAASGPFSEPSIRKDRRPAHGSLGGYGAGSGSRATLVKSESSHGASSFHRSSGVSVKKEEGGYISSDDDDQDAEFPRKDIDLIEVSSDEDESEAASKDRMNLPVRIRRKEHTERVVGINTEASSETSAKILQKVEESGSAPTADLLERISNKGKGKAKDLEITGEGKPYKGVWQDSEDSDVKVKTEPTSEDEDMIDAEQVGIDASAVKTGKQAELLPVTERRHRLPTNGVPSFQTDEERAEWARFQMNLGHIRAELGPEENTQTVDTSNDVVMADTDKGSRRDDFVYLFQLPPILPDLIAPEIKKVTSDAPAATSSTSVSTDSTPTATSTPTTKSEAVPIKKEEEFSNPLGETPERSRFTNGYVGKLRVHQSGRTTMDWGGTGYELAPGNEVKFLQEVVSIHVVPEKDRVVEEEAGEAISFGRVKGKFVATPDFAQLLS